MAQYELSGVLNDRERPRILLWCSSSERVEQFSWLRAKAGTYRHVYFLSDVDLSEWDVLVTDEPHLAIVPDTYGLNTSRWSRVPDHLYLFRVFDSGYSRGDDYFEVNVDEDDDAILSRALRLSRNVPGHKMTRVNDLPARIQELVKSDLLQTAERRAKQFGIDKVGDPIAPAATKIRPFLVGPQELMLAASYERPGGRPVWLIPRDVFDLEAWFDAAQVEWHLNDLATFPSVATWQTSSTWDTTPERQARAHLDAIEASHAAATAKYETTRTIALQSLESASAAATVGPKSLLTGQDDPLQGAVLEALRSLGFVVEDMDEVWPERERREDFRISDTDAPGWLALADATGVTKGAPGSKIATLLGYVTKYVLEEKPSAAPAIWVIVNRLIARDPLARGDIYRADELTVLTDSSGIALDTPALFVLTREIPADSPRAAACRQWLREARGQVTLQDALAWLTANT